MAFADFSLTDLYNNIITKLNTQLTSLGSLFRNQSTGDFTNQVRYNSTGTKLEYWSGSAWLELDISGQTIDAATASTTCTTASNATTHIADVAGAVHGAVAANTANMLVRRDANGDVWVRQITATQLNGNVTGSSGSCTGNAASASAVTWGNVSSKPFNYSGQAGTPIYVWGTNDGTNYYVWQPSLMSVNYASSAGSAPASDVYSWAKQATKPSYSYSEVGAPSTTGGNASGTWGINITGQAATVATVQVATGSTFGGLKFSVSGTTLNLSSSGNV